MSEWRKERDVLGLIHYLAIPDSEYCMKVEKSAAGDYFATIYLDGEPCGGYVTYFESLLYAKQWCEEVIISGEWKDYILE
jgi:hypothetical protein